MTTCPHCGAALTKSRSLPDHRRFFALIHAAYESWPEGHEFQPDNPEHLRAWLLAKAGYRESIPIDLPEDATEHMTRLFRLGIEAALQAAGSVAFVVPYRAGVAVVKPKSIAWTKLDQRGFAAVREAVEAVLARELSLDPEALLNADPERRP